jgi:hypothetical protein
MNRMGVGILIFPDVEVLDFCGPYEVFSVTRLNEERRREELSPFAVFFWSPSGPNLSWRPAACACFPTSRSKAAPRSRPWSSRVERAWK